MKKIMMIIIAIMAISKVAFSQITIDKLYVGSLSGTSFSIDSLHTSSFTSVRMGAMATYKPAKWIEIKGWGMVQSEASIGKAQGDVSKVSSLQQIWIRFNPSGKLSIEVGSMATLPTEQRPHPVSIGGHFETWSQAQIPGMALNAKAKYQLSKSIKVGAGIAVRRDSKGYIPEYSGMINFHDSIATLSAWYANNLNFGSVLTVSVGRFSSNLVYKQNHMDLAKPENILANNISLNISKKANLFLYFDNGFDLGKNKLVRSENGIYKCFDSEWIGGLFCIGYNYVDHTINAYVMFHLSSKKSDGKWFHERQ
ncbi:MAG: hypothetical protein WCI00_01905 [bacterium]